MASNVKLIPGEQIAFELEADFWNVGNNPIQKAFGKFFKTVAKIFGYKIRGFLTVTNMRVIETKDEIRCYCIPISRTTKVVLPHSIKEVGYTMEKICGIFFENYYFYYEGLTQATLIQIQDGTDEKLMDYVQKFYEAIKS